MAAAAGLKGVLGVTFQAQEPEETFKSSLEDTYTPPLSLPLCLMISSCLFSFLSLALYII